MRLIWEGCPNDLLSNKINLEFLNSLQVLQPTKYTPIFNCLIISKLLIPKLRQLLPKLSQMIPKLYDKFKFNYRLPGQPSIYHRIN